MSFVDLIKSLSFNFNLNKKTGSHSTQSKIKQKNVHRSITSARDSNIKGDFVAGDKHHNNAQDRLPFIEIQRDMAMSSQGTYNVRFIFRNLGESTATLQNFILAGESMPIEKKTLAPSDQPYEIERDITNSKIRNTKIDNPIARIEYKSLAGKLYATNAKVLQGSMAVPTFNIEKIEDNEFEIIGGAKK